MKVGDTFDMRGYENVATLAYAEDPGYVYVMHNNSSYVLVASQGPDSTTVVLQASFMYVPEGFLDYQGAYRAALLVAMELACQR